MQRITFEEWLRCKHLRSFFFYIFDLMYSLRFFSLRRKFCTKHYIWNIECNLRYFIRRSAFRYGPRALNSRCTPVSPEERKSGYTDDCAHDDSTIYHYRLDVRNSSPRRMIISSFTGNRKLDRASWTRGQYQFLWSHGVLDSFAVVECMRQSETLSSVSPTI